MTSTVYSATTIAKDLQLAQESGTPSEVKTVQFRQFLISSLYYSPYPKECQVPQLFVCHHCFSYYKKKDLLYSHIIQAHSAKEPILSSASSSAPANKRRKQNKPATKFDALLQTMFTQGHETVYKEDQNKLVRVDSKLQKLFCQNLCLFGKLFISKKTLFYDITRFYFFVLYVDNNIVGYFSKERDSEEDYNLSCIIVFPCYQRKGYGQLLIDLSYAISRKEGVKGTPERPLSNMGRNAYFAFWKAEILLYFEQMMSSTPNTLDAFAVSLEELSDKLLIQETDLLETLKLELKFDIVDDSMILVNRKILKSALDQNKSRFKKVNLLLVHVPEPNIISPVDSVYTTFSLPAATSAKGFDKKTIASSAPTQIRFLEKKSLIISLYHKNIA
jgi:ribosomal protein S18 acetylase RimI-like enzyme